MAHGSDFIATPEAFTLTHTAPSSDRKAAATTWRFHLPTEKSRPYHVARISQILARGPMPEAYPIVRTMWLTTSCPCHPKRPVAHCWPSPCPTMVSPTIAVSSYGSSRHYVAAKGIGSAYPHSIIVGNLFCGLSTRLTKRILRWLGFYLQSCEQAELRAGKHFLVKRRDKRVILPNLTKHNHS